MAGLDDLLALLPDNETGEISAADMRTIVTALWSDQMLSWDARWQYVPTPGAVPGGRQVTFDTAAPADAAWIRLDVFSQDDVDRSGLVAAIRGGDVLRAQHQSDADTWVELTATGPATRTAGYVEIPVVAERAGGGDDPDWQSVTILFGRRVAFS